MRKRDWQTYVLSAIGWLVTSGAVVAEAPPTVSPGSHEGNEISTPCPTFSWGSVDAASLYELVVYEVGAEGGETRPAFRRRIPGSANVWTPGLEQCLARGAAYAWMVRARGPQGWTSWSAPWLFRISRAPELAEVQAALEVVRSYLAEGGQLEPASSSPPDESGAGARAMAAPTVMPTGSTATQLTVDGGVVANLFTGDLLCSGCISNSELGLNSVTATRIAAGAVGTSEVANNSLTSFDLAANSVGKSEIATSGVGSLEIEDGAVRGPDLGGIVTVVVECNGSCVDTSLASICPANYDPLAVSCDDSIDLSSGGTPCGADNRCSFALGFNALFHCKDTGGTDAVVVCIQK